MITTLKQLLQRGLLVLSMVALLLGLIAVQPGYAANAPTARQPQPIVSDRQTVARENAYEEAVEAVNNPTGLEKEYEKDLEEYEEANPDQKGILQDAKELLNKVTGEAGK